MIEIKNLLVRYDDRDVLNIRELSFPNTGLFCVVGPSGCGKSTLLNCLSGIIPFRGEIKAGEYTIDKNCDNDKYRLNKLGFVFQDFRLFKNQSIYSNIVFPLETSCSLKKDLKEKKCLNLLELVGLPKSFLNKTIEKCSGGEKQRVAIARALVNDPAILLADEPTGSLDSKNSDAIMQIFRKISKTTLVIVVTHDLELANRYADKIIALKDGNIQNVCEQNVVEDVSLLPILKTPSKKKRNRLDFKFALQHSLSKLKQKKGRTFVMSLITSLALLTMGFATLITSSISTSIKKSYSTIVDDYSIVIRPKNNSLNEPTYIASSLENVLDLKKTYNDSVLDIGVNYYANFESYFPDKNEFSIITGAYKTKLPDFSIRHINEFLWYDLESPHTYPRTPTKLEEDEVVLGLPYDNIKSICLALRIERTINSLSNYINENDLYLVVSLENKSWSYSDEQIFRVVGFSLESSPKMFHYDHRWNEKILKERMRFPSGNDLSQDYFYPWVMFETCYLQVYSSEHFLKETFYKKDSDNYIFELGNSTFFPISHKLSDGVKNKVLIFDSKGYKIPPRYSEYFESVSSHIKNPLYGSDGGYAIYPNSLLMGFADQTYFSFSKEILEGALDYLTSNSVTQEKDVSGPQLISGHFSKPRSSSVTFKVLPKSNKGDLSLNDIVVSRGLVNKIAKKLDPFNNKLNMAIVYSDSNGRFKDYDLVSLDVVEIIENDDIFISHEEHWPICFYQCKTRKSAFSLLPNCIAFDIDNIQNIQSIKTVINKNFADYEAVYPLEDVNKSVDKICFYIGVVLVILSSVCFLISVLLLSLLAIIYIKEIRNDIFTARLIGVKHQECRKFLYSHIFLNIGVSFVVSFIELLFSSVFVEYIIANNAGIPFHYSFNLFAFIFMSLMAVFIGLLTSFFSLRKFKNNNPIAAFKI